MAKKSAGLLVYRLKDNKDVQILLVHPGGPQWAKKDEHAWSIPKGEVEEDEDMLVAAGREFEEEIGLQAPKGELRELGNAKVSGGKSNYIWAVEGDLDVSTIKSNKLTMEWPPKSGKQIEIPEVDRAEWISLGQAKFKLHKGQAVFVDRLQELLKQLNPDIYLSGGDDAESKQQASLF